MKQVPIISAEEAVTFVKDGDYLMAGGFGMTGNPVHLLHGIKMVVIGPLNRWM